jgi:hypothetical protein
MTTLKENLEKKILNLKSEIESLNEKLLKDYCHAFSWSAPEDLYKLNKKLIYLKELDNIIVTKADRVSEYLTYCIERGEKELLSGGYMGRSTSLFSNIAHTLDKEVLVEIITEYKELKNNSTF